MNKKSKLKLAISALALSATGQVALAGGHGEITVAYFLEWPMPFEYAKQKGTYEDEMGVKINWVSFESGVKMSAAMASSLPNTQSSEITADGCIERVFNSKEVSLNKLLIFAYDKYGSFERR